MGNLFILCFNTKQAPTTLYHTAETLVAANKVCYYILRTYIVVFFVPPHPLLGTRSQHIFVYISPVHYVCVTACMLKYVIPERVGGDKEAAAEAAMGPNGCFYEASLWEINR